MSPSGKVTPEQEISGSLQQEASESGGSISLKDLVTISCERDGVADRAARRRIETAVPEVRSKARTSIAGFMVWQEPADERNPKVGTLIRTEG